MSGIFKLLFFSPKKDERLFKPFSYIALGDHGVKDNYHLLTPQLLESEVDGNIDYLITELEKIRKQAKRKYKKANAKEDESDRRRT
ncbi:MAG: hypothetical protein GKR94_33695 [Gammaproteobacteria bacterium]|nr:hypothetical protein [Gammaproteobacteria bacterium]